MMKIAQEIEGVKMQENPPTASKYLDSCIECQDRHKQTPQSEIYQGPDHYSIGMEYSEDQDAPQIELCKDCYTSHIESI